MFYLVLKVLKYLNVWCANNFSSYSTILLSSCVFKIERKWSDRKYCISVSFVSLQIFLQMHIAIIQTIHIIRAAFHECLCTFTILLKYAFHARLYLGLQAKMFVIEEFPANAVHKFRMIANL